MAFEGCSRPNAYVAWGGEDVNVFNNFFNSGFSASKHASILIHELAHAYNDADDYFYYPTDGSILPWNAVIETPTSYLDVVCTSGAERCRPFWRRSYPRRTHCPRSELVANA
ncbi:hypothetical protein [Mycobacterium sp. URHB0021]